MIPAIPLSLVLNRYTLMAIGFALYSWWVWQQGREFEQNRYAAAVTIVNGKVRAVVAKETEVAMREDALREKARAEATPVLAASAPCIVTADEAKALSRIR